MLNSLISFDKYIQVIHKYIKIQNISAKPEILPILSQLIFQHLLLKKTFPLLIELLWHLVKNYMTSYVWSISGPSSVTVTYLSIKSLGQVL